jgi:hypothetical protein
MTRIVCRRRVRWTWITATLCVAGSPLGAAEVSLPSQFQWRSTGPLLTARDVDGWHWHAVKDPSIVRHEGRWHLFATVRGSDRSHAILSCSFGDWSEAETAPRRILPMHAGYFCAPQVFWFTPHQRWYLICQASDPAWGEPAYRAAFSTTETIADPDSWSPLTPLFTPERGEKIGLDFWVICDDAHAHLFSTTNDGRMWRRETALADFPRGWSRPVLALQDDVFEASHTYRLVGSSQYLTIIEAQGGHGWRYYKAYVADRLDGAWRPLAATKENSFASLRNVRQPAGRWTDSISHGELLRHGVDERLEVEPANLRLLYQGVSDADRAGKQYGDIPWRLGLLEPETP